LTSAAVTLTLTSAAVTLALALWSPAALGSQTVSTTDQLTFEPPSVTITQGETVTWMNPGGGLHNVAFDDGTFKEPIGPLATTWTVSRTFSQPGVFTYYCEQHRDANMKGTVTVNAAPAGGGGGGGGGGGVGGGPPPPDTAPVSSLSSAAKQDVDKLFVRASMNEAGTLFAAATVSVPGLAQVYRFKRATKKVAANQSVKLRLKLKRTQLKKVKRVLRKHKLRAKVTLTAVDVTGKKTIRKQKIRLRD